MFIFKIFPMTSFYSAYRNRSFMWTVYFDDLIYCVHLLQVQSASQNHHSYTTAETGLSNISTSQLWSNNLAVRFRMGKVTMYLGECQRWLLKKILSCIYIVPFSFQRISTYIISFVLILKAERDATFTSFAA